LIDESNHQVSIVNDWWRERKKLFDFVEPEEVILP
jgi:hypothetical protein